MPVPERARVATVRSLVIRLVVISHLGLTTVRLSGPKPSRSLLTGSQPVWAGGLTKLVERA